MKWLDTTGPTVYPLKIRNQANSAWIILIPDVQVASGGLLALAGGTLTGPLAMGTQKITGLASGTAATDAINKGQADGRIITLPLSLGTISATGNKYLVAPGAAASTIVDVELVSELGVASSGTDYWEFQVRNITDSLDLRATVKSTNGAAITADAIYQLGLGQNLALAAAGKVLRLQMTKFGAAANLQGLLALVHYKVTTP